MCGIAGFTGPIQGEKLDKMLDLIAHRGPDGTGTLKRPKFSIGMRRLAIIDRDGGWQPVWNEDESIAIVFNGEIYNHAELRAELVKAGHIFKSDHSDTETIVHGYEQWGHEVLQKLRGMFAFAIWDSTKDELFIARDKLGIKPLYYSWIDENLVFASEIKAITKAWDIDRSPNPTAIYRFLRYRIHDNDDQTFFQNVHRLLAGHYLVINLDNPQTAKSVKYWNPEVNTKFASEKYDHEYAAEFRDQFKDAVAAHLVTDVPLGVALSGGLDSTGIAAMTNQLRQEGSANTHTNKLLSFSTVYPGASMDESAYIKLAADYVGAEMNTVQPTARGFWDEIREWVYYQEEPTISSAPYAYYSMYRLASSQVRVMLSGNGGDELLAGYIPYFAAYVDTARAAGQMSSVIREIVRGGDLYWKYWFDRVTTSWKRPIQVSSLLNADFQKQFSGTEIFKFKPSSNLNLRLFEDLTALSIPNLTRYDDRNSMAFSVESRPPFLDHKLVEYILSLPADQKIKYGWNRWIYRNAMNGILPEQIRKRRSKIGFTNPEKSWLIELQDEYRQIFASDSFRSRPYWNADQVLAAFNAILAGKDGDILMFWRILNVELWLQIYCD